MARRGDLTGLLVAWGRGDHTAGSQLIAAVYEDLRLVARRRLRAERRDHSLTPTALVHETYLRLVDLGRIDWRNRAQFFAIAAQAMRRILVDHARALGAGKRGGGTLKVPLAEHLGATLPADIDLLDLDTALTRLGALNARQSHLVELRFFGGLSVEEAAEVLNRSPATIKRDWALARAWLYLELRGRRKLPTSEATNDERGRRAVSD